MLFGFCFLLYFTRFLMEGKIQQKGVIMTTNYEVRYYNWSRVLKDQPKYENRIFGSLKNAQEFMEQKFKEFLDDVDPEVEFLGDSEFNPDRLAIEAWFYEEDRTPVSAYIYIEEVDVDENLEF